MDDHDGILARLNSHDSAVVNQAAFDAADASRADVVPPLLKLLQAGNLETMGAVAYALGELGAQEAQPCLWKWLKDPKTEGKRGSLVYALMGLDCGRHCRDVLDLLYDRFFEVRQKAIIILEDIVSSQSLEELAASRADLLGGLNGMSLDDGRRAEVADALEIIDGEMARRSAGSLDGLGPTVHER